MLNRLREWVQHREESVDQESDYAQGYRAALSDLRAEFGLTTQLPTLPRDCWLLVKCGVDSEVRKGCITDLTWNSEGVLKRVSFVVFAETGTYCLHKLADDPDLFFNEYEANEALEQTLQAAHGDELPCSRCKHLLGCGPTKMSTNYWRKPCQDKEV